MTTKTLNPESVYFLGPVTVMTQDGVAADGIVTRYGQELVVTDEIRHLNTDTNSVCWLDLADDEPAQIRRWGKVLMGKGEWPNDAPRLERGSDEWLEAAAAARREAWKIENETERAQRMRDIKDEFGAPPTTSRTVQSYGLGRADHD